MIKYCIRLLIVISPFFVAPNGICQNYNDIQPVLGSPQLREVDMKLEMPKPISISKKKDQGLSLGEISNNNKESFPIGWNSSNVTIPKPELVKVESKLNLPTDVLVLLAFVILAIVFLILSAIYKNNKKKVIHFDSVNENEVKQMSYQEPINQQIVTLEKLFDLKEKGAISEDEYKKIKSKLVE